MSEQSNPSPEPQRGYWVGPPPPWRTPEAIAQRRIARDLRRNYFLRPVTPATGSVGVLIQSAERWLVPWPSGAYPGRSRGVRQLLGVSEAVAQRALRGLASRRNTAKLVAELRRRCAAGMAIADALDAALAARPADRPNGLCIIDEATGLRKHQARHGRRQRVPAGEATAEPLGEATAQRSGERPL